VLEGGAIADEPLIQVENLAKHFPVTRGLLAIRTNSAAASASASRWRARWRRSLS
jgi:hypothetical protein